MGRREREGEGEGREGEGGQLSSVEFRIPREIQSGIKLKQKIGKKKSINLSYLECDFFFLIPECTWRIFLLGKGDEIEDLGEGERALWSDRSESIRRIEVRVQFKIEDLTMGHMEREVGNVDCVGGLGRELDEKYSRTSEREEEEVENVNERRFGDVSMSSGTLI